MKALESVREREKKKLREEKKKKNGSERTIVNDRKFCLAAFSAVHSTQLLYLRNELG